MPWSGHLMSKPISIGDISRAVHNSSLDVGTLIARGDIKKWALHKPVMLLTGYDTPSDLYTSDSDWLTHMQQHVREVNSNTLCPYGLKVGTSINLYDVIGENNAPTVDWVYQKPPETGTYWRRMLDFNGYTDQPNPPVNKPNDFAYNRDSTNTLYINTNDGEAGTGSIQLSELSSLDGYNLMLAIKTSTLWYLYVMDTSIPDSVEAGTISLTIPSLPNDIANGTYDAYIVGITNADPPGVHTNTWISQQDSGVRNFYSMIPLPLPTKLDCKFNFIVRNMDPAHNPFLQLYYDYTDTDNLIRTYTTSGSSVSMQNAMDYHHGMYSNGPIVIQLKLENQEDSDISLDLSKVKFRFDYNNQVKDPLVYYSSAPTVPITAQTITITSGGSATLMFVFNDMITSGTIIDGMDNGTVHLVYKNEDQSQIEIAIGYTYDTTNSGQSY